MALESTIFNRLTSKLVEILAITSKYRVLILVIIEWIVFDRQYISRDNQNMKILTLS